MNVEKRRDSARGSRFLLELELQERGGSRQRLSEYVFLRLPGARVGDEEDDGESPEPPPAASIHPDSRPELCRPLHLAWRQDVMVHFIVPGMCASRRRSGVGREVGTLRSSHAASVAPPSSSEESGALGSAVPGRYDRAACAYGGLLLQHHLSGL